MKKGFLKFAVSTFLAILIPLVMVLASITLVYAEEQEETKSISGTSISISPVSKIFQLSAGSTYSDVLSVTNDGNGPIKFEVYSAPYSYVYSEENDSYALGFSNENNYTQIARWISIMDSNGDYVERPTFVAEAGQTVDVTYQVKTPNSLPAGGQYAVLFAHTLSDSSSAGGIRTEASPGMVIYGRANGETIISSEISDAKINKTINESKNIEDNGKTTQKEVTVEHINASVKVKNTGNVDFNASGVLKVENLFGGTIYETPENKSKLSIIPEAELVLSDEWEETPSFGIYRATWIVTAGDNTETTEMVICMIPPYIIIISIILLTILVIWIIIGVRKRKERHSRLAV